MTHKDLDKLGHRLFLAITIFILYSDFLGLQINIQSINVKRALANTANITFPGFEGFFTKNFGNDSLLCFFPDYNFDHYLSTLFVNTDVTWDLQISMNPFINTLGPLVKSLPLKQFAQLNIPVTSRTRQ